MQKIKVLHILYSFGIGGMEKGISMVINHASPEFEHAILCLNQSGDSRQLISSDIPVFEMHKPPGNSVKFIARLAKLIREIRPDIVHTRNWGGMDGIIAARLAGCRGIVHGEHGWGIDDPQGQSPKRKFARRWLSLLIREFTAVSRQIQDWLVEDIKVFRPVSQVYNGVEKLPVDDPLDRSWLYRDLNLQDSALLIATVGRLDPIKDQAGLIDSFAQLRMLVPESHLLIVGDGPERKKLEEKSVAGVHFLGSRRDVARILRSIDVFVLPSLNEGISNTILEAMAAGLPIVATAVGGTPELVTDGNNGLLVSSGDHQALTAALQRYLINPQLRSEHGLRNLEIIAERFSIASMVDGYESVWRRVAIDTGAS